MKQPLTFRTPNSLSASATEYVDVVGGLTQTPGTVESGHQAPWPCDGVFRNLIIKLNTAPGAGKSFTFTVRKDGSDTALVVQIADTATTGRLVGTDVACTAGQLIAMQIVPAGTPSVPSEWWVSMEFEGSVHAQSGYAANGGLAGSSSPLLTNGAFHPGNFTDDATLTRSLAATAGSITALYGTLNSNPGASVGWHLYINLNGVRQDGTGGTVDTQVVLVNTTAANRSFTLAIAAGDLVYAELVRVGSPPSRTASMGTQFTATVDGLSHFCGSSRNTTIGTTNTVYQVPSMRSNPTWGTTESTRQAIGGVSTFTLGGFRVLLATAPGAGKSRVFDGRLNSASPGGGPTLTIADTATSGSDASGAMTVVDGDVIGIRQVPVSSPTATTLIWAFVASMLPGGGISPPPGTNPPSANVPVTTPQVFITIAELSGSPAPQILATYAEARGGPFADAVDYFGGYKEARILTIAEIRRAYTTPTGGLQLTTVRITLDDVDSALRNLWGVTTLKGRKLDVYTIEHDARLNEEEPYRLFSGTIVEHNAGDDFTYEITVEGMLGRHSAKTLRELKIPRTAMDPTEFPVLAERWQSGWYPPIGYGALSDEGEATPQGVVRGQYVGSGNLQTLFGGINQDVDFYVFFRHAVQSVINLYVNDPDAPDVRVLIPPSEYGVNIWAPHKPNWTDANPLGDNFIDYTGYRYTVAAVNSSHGWATALREGRSILAGNFYGIEDVGDATGNRIEAPSRIVQHFWTNFVENDWKTGDWFPVPAFGDYSLFDSDRVDAAASYSDGLGLFGALLIAPDGRPEALFDIIKTMSSNWDLDIGENRHGQIICDYEDTSESAIVTFNSTDDAVRFSTYTEHQTYANVVRYRSGYRYIEPSAPKATGAAGDPLPRSPVHAYSPWTSGLVVIKNAAAIAVNNGQEVPLDLDLYGVRDATAAAVVAQRILARSVGPSTVLEGAVGARLTTGVQGLGIPGVSPPEDIDLGTVIAITHAEGLGVGGYTAKRHRLRTITDQPLVHLRTLDGRMLTG